MSVMDGLRQDFPNDARIARWANEPDIGEKDFEFLLLGCWIKYLDRVSKTTTELSRRTELALQRRGLDEKRREIHRQINAED